MVDVWMCECVVEWMVIRCDYSPTVEKLGELWTTSTEVEEREYYRGLRCPRYPPSTPVLTHMETETLGDTRRHRFRETQRHRGDPDTRRDTGRYTRRYRHKYSETETPIYRDNTETGQEGTPRDSQRDRDSWRTHRINIHTHPLNDTRTYTDTHIY